MQHSVVIQKGAISSSHNAPTLNTIITITSPTVKECHTHEKCRRGAHLPFLGREPGARYTTEVYDAWPVRCETYGYLPSRRASPPLDRYQIILLDDIRYMCVNNLPKVVT